jgi:hypothetical protein
MIYGEDAFWSSTPFPSHLFTYSYITPNWFKEDLERIIVGSTLLGQNQLGSTKIQKVEMLPLKARPAVKDV